MEQVGSGYVLLCEDDLNDVFLFKHEWRRAGFNTPVRVMADGEEVLNLLKRCVDKNDKCPILIISDHRLIAGGGMDILEFVHGSPMFNCIPILLTSGVIDPDARSKALEMGAVDYLEKPLTAEVMQELVARLPLATPLR
ncbi:MAG: response regulator [Verrucomicrobiales bacterium]|nr:response regulator [Verrucomicrobiales bacterium]